MPTEKEQKALLNWSVTLIGRGVSDLCKIHVRHRNFRVSDFGISRISKKNILKGS